MITQRTSTEKKQIVLLSVSGIFLTLIITALILGIPYYKQIKSHAISNLQLLTDNKASILSHQLYRYRNQALSISQRIHATRLLAEYYRDEINLEELKLKSSRILKEAIAQTDDIVGIIRLSNTHLPLLEMGLSIPAAYWQPYIASKSRHDSPHIIHLQGSNILLLKSSISNHFGKVIGTDIVVFDTKRLSDITEPHEQDKLAVSYNLYTVNNDKIRTVLPYLAPNAKTDKDNQVYCRQNPPGQQ